MKEHQKTTQINAVQVTQYIGFLRQQTQIKIELIEDEYQKKRLDHAIDVLDIAAAAFDVALNLIIPFAAD